jgi:hypothetical protein
LKRTACVLMMLSTLLTSRTATCKA